MHYIIIGGSTYVPIRTVSEILGAQVKWDGAQSTVLIEHMAEKTDRFQLSTSRTMDSKVVVTGAVEPEVKVLRIAVSRDGLPEDTAYIDIQPNGSTIEQTVFLSFGSGDYIIDIYDETTGDPVLLQTMTVHNSDPDAELRVGEGYLISSTISEDGWVTFSGKNPAVKLLTFDICIGDSECTTLYKYPDPATGEIEVRLPLSYGTGTYRIQVSGADEALGLRNSADSAYSTEYKAVQVTNQFPSDPALMPEQDIPSDAPALIALAGQLTAGLHTDLEKSKAIYRWVTSQLTYDFGDAKFEAAELDVGINQSLLTIGQYKIRAGTSLGFSNITAALHRAAGIPANVAIGEIAVDPSDLRWSDIYEAQAWGDSIARGAWNEIYIDGAWLIVDALTDPEIRKRFMMPTKAVVKK
jgi:hypothetical protein